MLKGKGFYLWRVADTESGNIDQIVATARAARLDHVLIKMSDAAYPYNAPYLAALVSAFRAANIDVWGWGYAYSTNPLGEADIALAQIRRYQPTGWIINAEVEYKNHPDAARAMMARLRAALPAAYPLGLSSYRWPSYHPEFPFDAFAKSGLSFFLPQVYWMGAHNPAYQLERTLAEHRARWPSIPVYPTGAAFRQNGWQPTSAEVSAFLAAVRSHNLPAANFWEWANCRRYLPAVWEVISLSTVGANPPAPPPPPTEHRVFAPIVTRVATLRMRDKPATDATSRILTTFPQGTRLERIDTVTDSQGREFHRIAGWVAGKHGPILYSSPE